MRTILGVILLCNLLFAGDVDRGPENAFVFPQSIPIHSYNCLGFSNMINAQLSELGSANPASISNFNDRGIGVNFLYNTQIELYESILLDRPRPYIPSSFSLIYPIQNFSIGLSYTNSYHNLITFKDVTIDVGTGIQPPVLIDICNEHSIYSFSGIVGYFFPEIFGKDDLISLAFQLNYDYFYNELEFSDENYGNAAGYSTSYSWKLGLMYKKEKIWGMGILFEKGFDNTESELKGDLFVHMILPDKTSMGFDIALNQSLNLSTTISYIMWNDINKFYKDRIEVSAGAIYDIDSNMALSLGAVFTGRNEEYPEYGQPTIKENLDITIIGLGFRAQLDPVTLRTQVDYTHYSSSKNAQMISINIGLDYYF